MSATVQVMPGVRPIYVPDLSTQQKVARIEDLASATGLTPEMTHDLLLTVAHPWLVGAALMDAWMKAEQAIALRDATRVLDEDGFEAAPELQDEDFEGYKERAEDAIGDLIHGTNISTARGGGLTSRGNEAS
jgi:hypothetical protein